MQPMTDAELTCGTSKLHIMPAEATSFVNPHTYFNRYQNPQLQSRLKKKYTPLSVSASY